MVTNLDNGAKTYVGLSTDDKPEGVANGSIFIEMDTGTVYFYDAEGEEWDSL